MSNLQSPQLNDIVTINDIEFHYQATPDSYNKCEGCELELTYAWYSPNGTPWCSKCIHLTEIYVYGRPVRATILKKTSKRLAVQLLECPFKDRHAKKFLAEHNPMKFSLRDKAKYTNKPFWVLSGSDKDDCTFYAYLDLQWREQNEQPRQAEV